MDFEKIFEEAFAAMKLELGEGASKAGNYLQQIMEENKDALRRTTGYYTNGQVNEEGFKSLLEDNMKSLESQLLNLDILKKKTIENVVNAGIDVITTFMIFH